ncbi:MAG TPA: alpha-amylase, partial [Candidatus Vogelbacteria bacterium]|nr:alpha-amylase [Candidatus Vogelbacteria bacterium]
AICFYFQVHQPYRLKKFRIFDIGQKGEYFNDDSGTDLDNKFILKKVADKCYRPMNNLLLELLKKYPDFKISFSFSGITLEQLEKDAPDVLDLFKKMVDTGRVEVLAETYYHSLACLYSSVEFISQVEKHKKKIKEIFGIQPKIFRNTELIYNDSLAPLIKEMGFEGVLAEGAEDILSWRSPNFVYQTAGEDLKLLLKNYRLSDDIAFRFSSREWSEFPLTAEKYADWLTAVNGSGDIVNLFMDYETFGEHQWADSGIFDFMRSLPAEVYKRTDNSFLTPSEVIKKIPTREEISFPRWVSWADVERDLSAWCSNEMQSAALERVYALESLIQNINSKKLLEDWRRLQTSDHFYYMCVKWFADGDVHKYFNPYNSPYDAFITFMNALTDLELKANQLLKDKEKTLIKKKSKIDSTKKTSRSNLVKSKKIGKIKRKK